MTEFENYLEKRIEALEAGQSGASALPDLPEEPEGNYVLKAAFDPQGSPTIFDVEINAATPDGGDFTFTVDGETTALIPWDSEDIDKEAAINALPGVADSVTCFFDGGLWNGDGSGVIEFDPYAQGLVEAMSADGSNLTGPDAPYTLTVTKTDPGTAPGPFAVAWVLDD